MRNMRLVLFVAFLLSFVNIDAQDITPEFSAEITPSDCSGKTGAIDMTVKFPGNFIILDKDTKLSVSNLSLVNKRAFTLEGRIKVTEDDASFVARSYIALFGQKNSVSLGFRNGKLACTVNTNEGIIEYIEDSSNPGKNLFPTDGNWHHVALRGDGNKIELLIDGVVVGMQAKVYSNLIISGSLEAITIGDDVWGQTGEAFKGEIERISFWEKYLTGTDITNLKLTQVSSITKEIVGLLAAYNIDMATGSKLLATTSIEGFDLNALSSGSLKRMIDRVDYEWSGSGIINKYVEDIENLGPGGYTANIYYMVSGVYYTSSNTFRVGLNNNLKASIIGEIFYGCEGEEVNINTSVSGGVAAKSYMWKLVGGGFDYIPGTDKSFIAPTGYVGGKAMQLIVRSGVCTKETDVKTLILSKEIKTNSISRKK